MLPSAKEFFNPKIELILDKIEIMTYFLSSFLIALSVMETIYSALAQW